MPGVPPTATTTYDLEPEKGSQGQNNYQNVTSPPAGAGHGFFFTVPVGTTTARNNAKTGPHHPFGLAALLVIGGSQPYRSGEPYPRVGQA